jgi:hypothetical protein
MTRFATFVIVFVIGLGLGYWLSPERVQYVDRDLIRMDTVQVVVPHREYVYRRVVERDTVRIEVPVGMPTNDLGVLPVPRRSVSQTRSGLRLTYYHVPSATWRQADYVDPLRVAPVVFYNTVTRTPAIGATVSRAGFSATAAVQPKGFLFGVSVRL